MHTRTIASDGCSCCKGSQREKLPSKQSSEEHLMIFGMPRINHSLVSEKHGGIYDDDYVHDQEQEEQKEPQPHLQEAQLGHEKLDDQQNSEERGNLNKDEDKEFGGQQEPEQVQRQERHHVNYVQEQEQDIMKCEKQLYEQQYNIGDNNDKYVLQYEQKDDFQEDHQIQQHVVRQEEHEEFLQDGRGNFQGGIYDDASEAEDQEQQQQRVYQANHHRYQQQEHQQQQPELFTSSFEESISTYAIMQMRSQVQQQQQVSPTTVGSSSNRDADDILVTPATRLHSSTIQKQLHYEHHHPQQQLQNQLYLRQKVKHLQQQQQLEVLDRLQRRAAAATQQQPSSFVTIGLGDGDKETLQQSQQQQREQQQQQQLHHHHTKQLLQHQPQQRQQQQQQSSLFARSSPPHIYDLTTQSQDNAAEIELQSAMGAGTAFTTTHQQRQRLQPQQLHQQPQYLQRRLQRLHPIPQSQQQQSQLQKQLPPHLQQQRLFPPLPQSLRLHMHQRLTSPQQDLQQHHQQQRQRKRRLQQQPQDPQEQQSELLQGHLQEEENKEDKEEERGSPRPKAPPPPRDYRKQVWDYFYYKAKQFREKNGHCVLSHKFNAAPDLVRWAARQRNQYKAHRNAMRDPKRHISQLIVDKIEELNKIGFCWDAHEVVWEERYNDLKKFGKLHGHFNVPNGPRSNPLLADWAKSLRRQYRSIQQDRYSSLTPERIKKLNDIGFNWEAKNSTKYPSSSSNKNQKRLKTDKFNNNNAP